MWEFIFVSASLLLIGLFFIILDKTKAGKRFFGEVDEV